MWSVVMISLIVHMVVESFGATSRHPKRRVQPLHNNGWTPHQGHGVSLKKISPKSMLRLEYCVKDKCKMLFRNGVTSHLIEWSFVRKGVTSWVIFWCEKRCVWWTLVIEISRWRQMNITDVWIANNKILAIYREYLTTNGSEHQLLFRFSLC